MPSQLTHADNPSHASFSAPRRRSIGIRLLAIEKALGACFFLAAATTLASAAGPERHASTAGPFAGELREDPHDAPANLLIGFLPQVSTTALLTLGLVALGDMLLHAIEAAGLWLGQLWVEYLILIETAGLLPYEAIRNLLQQVLAEAGHEVDSAPDSLSAMDQVRFQAPDLIVLDLFTPRMDGWEFLNVTRTSAACQKVPVVVVTASDQLPSDRRIRAVIKKPFDLSLLTATVDSLLHTPATQLVV